MDQQQVHLLKSWTIFNFRHWEFVLVHSKGLQQRLNGWKCVRVRGKDPSTTHIANKSSFNTQKRQIQDQTVSETGRADQFTGAQRHRQGQAQATHTLASPTYKTQDNLAISLTKSRVYIFWGWLDNQPLVWVISGCATGKEKRKSTGSRPVTTTGTDWPMQGARLIQRRGAAVTEMG